MAGERHAAVVERRSNGGTMLYGAVLLMAMVTGAFLLFCQHAGETRKNNAITSAADAAEGAAKDVGDAARKE